MSEFDSKHIQVLATYMKRAYGLDRGPMTVAVSPATLETAEQAKDKRFMWGFFRRYGGTAPAEAVHYVHGRDQIPIDVLDILPDNMVLMSYCGRFAYLNLENGAIV